MKKTKINLKKLIFNSNQPKKFSDALFREVKGEENKRSFAKTFVASGKLQWGNP